MVQVGLQLFNFRFFEITVVPDVIIFNKIVVHLFKLSDNVLHVVEECFSEELVIVVHLHERENVGFTNLTIAVHVKHLEGELFQCFNMLCCVGVH